MPEGKTDAEIFADRIIVVSARKNEAVDYEKKKSKSSKQTRLKYTRRLRKPLALGIGAVLLLSMVGMSALLSFYSEETFEMKTQNFALYVDGVGVEDYDFITPISDWTGGDSYLYYYNLSTGWDAQNPLNVSFIVNDNQTEGIYLKIYNQTTMAEITTDNIFIHPPSHSHQNSEYGIIVEITTDVYTPVADYYPRFKIVHAGY